MDPIESKLHHIAVGSGDVARLAEFYRDLFGLKELTRHLDAAGALRSIWVDLGGTILMIEHTHESPRPVAGIGAGPFLLAFRVSPAERERLERELVSRGHTIDSRTAFTSYCRDIDGNRIGLSHYPDPGVPGASHAPAPSEPAIETGATPGSERDVR
jgi:glyoxylase I family protein